MFSLLLDGDFSISSPVVSVILILWDFWNTICGFFLLVNLKVWVCFFTPVNGQIKLRFS